MAEAVQSIGRWASNASVRYTRLPAELMVGVSGTKMSVKGSE